MIEVTAKLTRGSVYLAGEDMECVISFKCPEIDANAKSQSNDDACEILAWASAQIHCQMYVNDEKVILPASSPVAQEELAVSNTATSFAPCVGERGHAVLATKPKILFCDVRLLPGECKTYIYRETLPSEALPSYRGHALKYTYKITVGTQRVGSTIRLLRIPIRVLMLPTILDNVAVQSESGDMAPSNPFLQNRRKESPLDLALQLLQNITTRRTPSFYNITNSHGKVVRFCLFKPAYKLGEDIVGTFDFSSSTVKCVQYSVTLQSEEIINEHCQRKTQQCSTIVSYNKHHEFCLFSEHSQMILPIPLTVTPSFTTDLATLQWRLHFEFVTTTSEMEEQPEMTDSGQSSTWQAPSSLDIETMVWDLPIPVYPTSSMNLIQGASASCDVIVCI
ncbi:hypothetical protein CHUAL_013683 [Chamberlinius hualienensis]